MKDKGRLIRVVYDGSRPKAEKIPFDEAVSEDRKAVFAQSSVTRNRSGVSPSGHSVAILFSGGYDSTALALSHLEKGDAVYPYFVGFDAGTDVEFNFKLAELTILAMQSFYGIERCSDLMRIFYCLGFGGMESRLTQQPLLALAASMVRVPEHGLDAVEIGFCTDDAAASCLPDLKFIYRANCRINFKREVPLLFPLCHTSHETDVERCLDFERSRGIDLPIHSGEQFKVDYYGGKGSARARMFVEFNNRDRDIKSDPHESMTVVGRGELLFPDTETVSHYGQ